MMTLDEAIAKATKLLKLSESSNANEAALAAQRAQEILARYNIDAAALAGDESGPVIDEPIADQGERLEAGGGRLAAWKPMLAQKVARVNSCRVYTCGSDIGIIGRASDVSKVRYLYSTLAHEVDKLTKAHAKGLGRSYAASFRIGVVSAIGEKLEAAQAKVAAEMRAEQTTGAGLVRIDKALARISDRQREVDAWVRNNMRLGTRRSNTRVNGGAREAGYAAGQSINIGGARAALGAGQGRLR